jgi:hypothetical protein
MNLRSFGESIVTFFANRPVRLLWLVLPLMAMESPGCVMSERPLTRFQDESIDTALFGEWMVVDDPGNRLVMSIGAMDQNAMEFRSFENDQSYIVLAGYASRVGDESYVNLQFVDAGCLDCSEAEFAAKRAEFQRDYASVLAGNPDNACTYMLIRYEFSGDGKLRYFAMDPELVLEAFRAGDLDGEDGEQAGPGEYDDLCITASRRRLRNYVREHGSAIFSKEEWTMVRRPAELAE